jgi:2-octaprenyl-6-methoxyphenol hydroxylase
MARAERTNALLDVAIVGGGLVGASLAAGLASSGRRVALIEAAVPPAAAPGWDERCIALNHASRQIFTALGVWEALAGEAAPILSTHISEQGRFGVARFTAEEAGLDALGHNVPVRAIGQTLWARMLALGGTELHCPARLESVDVTDTQVALLLADGTSLRARLLIAADGAGSRVRELMNVASQTRDYAQSAIVTAVRTSRPHRGCAYERFTPDGPIALLPKGQDASTCSLVWTTPAGQVESRMQCDDDTFIALAEQTFGERLGRMTTLGRRNAHRLSRVMSDELCAPRTLFIGNAAQSLHPVAAQGFNLGLRDVAAAIELLGPVSGDWGAESVLREYQRRRSGDRQRVADFTDRLVRVFSNRVPGLRGLRHLGLLALDLAPPLKQTVMWQNLGLGAAAPRLARGA